MGHTTLRIYNEHDRVFQLVFILVIFHFTFPAEFLFNFY